MNAKKQKSSACGGCYSDQHRHINNLDDGCLMHIFSFLSPIPGFPRNLFWETAALFYHLTHPQHKRCTLKVIIQNMVFHKIGVEFADRYNTALVCHRWLFLACHPRLWLRVDRTIKTLTESGVFPSIQDAVSAARPGDTILIGAGGFHFASNIQITKPLCLIGGGDVPDDTTLVCTRGSDSALEFLSTCKLANLTVKAELGCCLLHRSGRLIIEDCNLQCESNPLDYLSYAIITTAGSCEPLLPSTAKRNGDSVSVSQTRIKGGAKAVLTSGTLALQRVRVIYARTSILFWFDVVHQL